MQKEKSLVSSTGALEFAKRFMTEGVQVDLSPVSFKVLNMFGGYVHASQFRLLGLSLQTDYRIRGRGYRVYTTGHTPQKGKSRRWLRHWHHIHRLNHL